MNTFIKAKISIVLIIFSSAFLYAQDRPKYNMYNLYQPIINPAAMGSYDSFTATGLFNTQMTGFAGAPVSFLFDATAPIANTNAIIGGQILHDRIGARNRTQLSASFAYRIPIDLRNYFCLGMTATIQLIDANFMSLVQDPSDPITTTQSYQLWSPDFRLGAYYFRDNFYAGFSVANLFTIDYTDPTVRVNSKDMHFNFHAGYDFKINDHLRIQTSILWKQVLNSATQFDINAQLKYNKVFGIGLSYRTLNTLVFQTNAKILKRFTIGYSFNLGMGFSNRTEYTGHELILIYQVVNSKKKIAIQTPHY